MRKIIRSISRDEQIELIDGDYYRTVYDDHGYYAEFRVFLGPGGRPHRPARVHTPRVPTKRRA